MILESDATAPFIESAETVAPPAIGTAHIRILRNLFARGGTMHMSELGGIELDLMARGLIAWGKSRSGSYGAFIEITPTRTGERCRSMSTSRTVAARCCKPSQSVKS